MGTTGVAATDLDLFTRLAELALAANRADVAGECLRRAATDVASSLPVCGEGRGGVGGSTPLNPPANGGRADELSPERWQATGIQHLNAGKVREAEAAILQAIRLRPNNGVWHDHLGVIFAQQKRFAEAEATFRLAARLDPTNPSPQRNVIQSCFDQMKFDAATTAIRIALKREPHADDLRLQLAVALTELKQLDEAETLLLEMLKSGHASSSLWNRLGVVRGLAGKSEAAVQCFREQIRLDPQSGGAYANLAAGLGRTQKWAEAVEAGREAVRLDPQNAGGWANLGNAYRDLGRLDEARHALQEAIRLDPTSHEPYGNYALSLAMNGNVSEALTWYERAIRLKPDVAEVRFNRALALLTLGDYTNGWAEYEWRWRTEQMKGQLATRQFTAPVWRGEPLAGKTILIHTEQGHGDTIQFAKLLAQLADRGEGLAPSPSAGRAGVGWEVRPPLIPPQAGGDQKEMQVGGEKNLPLSKVIVVTAPPLVTLLQSCRGITQAIPPSDPLPVHDYHCPLMSLPLLLQLRVETIPSHAPYLTPSPEAVAKWHERLNKTPGFKVGIAWQGNPQHIGDRWRSVKLSRFAELATIPNVTLISLQKGQGSEQIAENPTLPILDLGSELAADFGDTAGLLMNLDLVITIDSALAHLSGALARPVWVALPLNADWRWMQKRPDTPWYSTARLFRQQTLGDWDTVFKQMVRELRGMG